MSTGAGRGLLTVAQVAERLGISTAQVYREIRQMTHVAVKCCAPCE